MRRFATQRIVQLVSVSLAAVFAASACVIMKTARIYDLDTGNILQASFKYSGSGKGPITVAKPDGATCAGEYVTVAGGTTGWGTVFATVYPPGGRATTATGTVITSNVENMQKGSAVASCSDGMVMECEYVTSAGRAQGYGACTDNHGARYKLMF